MKVRKKGRGGERYKDKNRNLKRESQNKTLQLHENTVDVFRFCGINVTRRA
jgi:hypothetical protein